MGARQHRQIGQRMRLLGELGDDFIQCGQQHGVARRFQHQRVREIVDVFRGAGEMNELGYPHYFVIVRQALLQEILDRFHIVIGDGLDVLHFLRIGLVEICRQRVEFGERSGRERRYLFNRRCSSQRLDPFDLDFDAMLNQPEFAEQRAQAGNLIAIAAIEWGQSGKRGEFHEANLWQKKLFYRKASLYPLALRSPAAKHDTRAPQPICAPRQPLFGESLDRHKHWPRVRCLAF